jgi:cytochrome P450 family 628
MDKIHEKYGDYVRVGPRDLSIIDVEAVPVVHGPTSKCRKGLWYSGGYHIEGSSLHTTRDKKNHKERRRIWDRAFNTKALKEYEPRINRHTALLMQQLEDRAAKDLRFDQWINFYSFDVMGDVGFSKSFDMLEKGREDRVIRKLHASMKPLGVFKDITWLMNLMLRLPILQKDLKEFMQWSADVLKERKKVCVLSNGPSQLQQSTLTNR